MLHKCIIFYFISTLGLNCIEIQILLEYNIYVCTIVSIERIDFVEFT